MSLNFKRSTKPQINDLLKTRDTQNSPILACSKPQRGEGDKINMPPLEVTSSF